jgi:hypothetical protein
MLSLDRGALTTPREAHALFIENGFESVRVYGIAVEEFSRETIPSYSDPLSARHSGRQIRPTLSRTTLPTQRQSRKLSRSD